MEVRRIVLAGRVVHPYDYAVEHRDGRHYGYPLSSECRDASSALVLIIAVLLRIIPISLSVKSCLSYPTPYDVRCTRCPPGSAEANPRLNDPARAASASSRPPGDSIVPVTHRSALIAHRSPREPTILSCRVPSEKSFTVSPRFLCPRDSQAREEPPFRPYLPTFTIRRGLASTSSGLMK
jgi:hypothetical protein